MIITTILYLFLKKVNDLIKKNIIKNKIGIIHLDVEGMEVNALKGAKETIDKNKPYLSLENNREHQKNNNYFLNFYLMDININIIKTVTIF